MERKPCWSHFAVSLFSCLFHSQEERRDSLQLQMAPASLGKPPGPICIILPYRLYRRPLLLPPRSSVLSPAPSELGPCPSWAGGPGRGKRRARARSGPPRGSCPMAAFLFAPQTPPNLTATLGRKPGLWQLPHLVAADTLALRSEATCRRPHPRDG